MEIRVKTILVNEDMIDMAELRRVAGDALEDVAEECLAEATTTVPIEEGMLSDTGAVSRDGLKAQVGYGTPYACYQHETVGLRHDAGREDHWLEKAVYRNEDRYTEYVAAKVRAALG